ncbi:MAG: hypothetical protein K2Y25_09375, partial [Pseudomonadaceae bacterium]|nr:hypothetical protein [Pseudomonadaceae bacterium]
MGDLLDKFPAPTPAVSGQGGDLFDKFGAPEPKPSGVIRRAVGDTGVSLLKGAIGIPEAAVGIADIVTGGQAGKLAENAGFRPKDAKAMLDDLYSPEQKAANQKIQEADGFVDTLSASVQNPSTIAHTVLESAPAMLAGGVVGRGVGALARLPAWALGAAGEGVVGAGAAAEGTRQQTEDGLLTGKQAALSALSGIGTGVIGAAGGKLANKLGIGDADTFLAGGATGAPAKPMSLGGRIAAGAASEGLLEEAPQSAQEQILSNIALDRDAMQGVGSAVATGLLAGGVMGGGAAGLIKPQVQPTPTAENPAPAPVDRPDPGAGPLSAAAFLLPAPEARLGLPAPDTLYADSQGNVNSTGPIINVDGTQQPAQQQSQPWVNPANAPSNGGPGMDQQTAQGEPAGLEGDFIPRSRFAGDNAQQPATIDGELAQDPPGLPAPQRLLADGRQDSGVIETNTAGESRQAKTGNVPPADYVPQGGNGMEAQVPNGRTYKTQMAAKKAVFDAGIKSTHEVIETAPKQFEVRPIAAPVAGQAEPATPAEPVAQPTSYVAGQTFVKGDQSYTVQSVAADGVTASAISPSSGNPFRIHLPTEQANGFSIQGSAPAESTTETPLGAVEVPASQSQPLTTQPAPPTTYIGLPAANKALRESADPAAMEVVKVGPKAFEVRPVGGAVQPVAPVVAPAKQQGARKIVDRERDSVLHAAIRLGGISTNYRQDTTGETKGNTNIPGVGALWSDKTGTSIDDMASLLD